MRLALILVVALVLAGCSGKDPPSKPAPQEPTPPPGPIGTVAWSSPVLLGTVNNGAEPTVVTGIDGTLYAATQLAVWRSEDGGRSWRTLGELVCPSGVSVCPGLEEPDSGVKGDGDADLWVGGDGRVHWMGLNDDEGTANLPYQVSTDRGDSWSTPVDLSSNRDGDRAWISGKGSDFLAVVWRQLPAPPSDERLVLVRVSHDGGQTWGETSAIAPDAKTSPIQFHPHTGDMAIALDDEGAVRVHFSRDNGTTWRASNVSQEPFVGHIFPSLAYDGHGTLYLVYATDRDAFLRGGAVAQPDDAAKQEPRVYLSVSRDGGNWSEPRQLNAEGTTAWFPWVAAGADGRIVVTWYQNDRGHPRQLADTVHVMAALSVDASSEEPSFWVGRVAQEPNHRGPECRSSLGCTRSLLDFFETTIHPHGYPVVVWAADLWPGERVDVMSAYMNQGPDLGFWAA